MNLRYIIGAVISLPLLPVMYFQGKRIKARIPDLPEATGKKGTVFTESNKNKSLRIIAVGESTIAGVGVKTNDEGFAGALATYISEFFKANVHWEVYARSGYTAENVHQIIIPRISSTVADMIVIGLGGNDAFKLNTPGKWRKEITILIDKLRIKYPTALIVFCNMPPIKEFPAFTPLIRFTIGNLVEIFGEELHNLTQDYDRVFYSNKVIKLDEWMVKLGNNVSRSDFFSDGVHPSKLTYVNWAKDLAINIKHYTDTHNILL
jgi:lysophospholipase L1-like esterase